jgi:hypothetical protein
MSTATRSSGIWAIPNISTPRCTSSSRSLRTALFNDFADRYFPAAVTDARVDAASAARHAALLKGHWSNSRGSQSNFLAAIGFLGQVKVGVDDKGRVVLPFTGVNGKPRQWTEVSPFLWLDLNDHERLAARVIDGKPVAFSIDLLSPFMIFQRVPWYQDAAWLLPLLIGSVTALLATALVWPVAALVRRRFGAKLALDQASLAAYRGSKFGALLLLGGLGAWTALLTWMIKDSNNLAAKSDLALHAVQLFGIAAFVGGAVLMLWNLRAVWKGERRWPAKVWSVVLALAALTVLWVAFTFHLIGLGSNY